MIVVEASRGALFGTVRAQEPEVAKALRAKIELARSRARALDDFQSLGILDDSELLAGVTLRAGSERRLRAFEAGRRKRDEFSTLIRRRLAAAVGS